MISVSAAELVQIFAASVPAPWAIGWNLGECYGCGLCAQRGPHGAAQMVQRSYGRQREARPM